MAEVRLQPGESISAEKFLSELGQGRSWACFSGLLGRYRWVVERTISWLHAWKKLRTCYKRSGIIHQALLTLACSMICYRFLGWEAVK